MNHDHIKIRHIIRAVTQEKAFNVAISEVSVYKNVILRDYGMKASQQTYV